MRTSRFMLTAAVLLGLSWPALGDDGVADQLNKLLSEGKTREARQAMEKQIDGPSGAQARFGLAVAQLMEGVEHLTQSLSKCGFRSRMGVPFLFNFRVPVAENSSPEEVSYEQIRAITQKLIDDLDGVEKTLAALGEREVKLPLRFGAIRLDLDGDGKVTDDEAFWKIYSAVSGERLEKEQVDKFVVGLDTADVQWLRGYCHLMMALVEASMAWDGHDLFERTAHLWLARPKSPHQFLTREDRDLREYAEIMDWIALIHGMHFDLKEPERMKRALEHLQAMTKCSRAMWMAALAETDDDNEWIPNPKQTSVVPGVKITDEMVASWSVFLDELDGILAGKKLIPFWRNADGKGINLRRVFTEPQPFDLIYWVQGTAATPYLERGELTSNEVWERLMRVFGGEFIGFALWFN